MDIDPPYNIECTNCFPEQYDIVEKVTGNSINDEPLNNETAQLLLGYVYKTGFKDGQNKIKKSLGIDGPIFKDRKPAS